MFPSPRGRQGHGRSARLRRAHSRQHAPYSLRPPALVGGVRPRARSLGARPGAAVTPTRLVVYGDPNDEVRVALSAFGAAHMAQIGGFARYRPSALSGCGGARRTVRVYRPPLRPFMLYSPKFPRYVPRHPPAGVLPVKFIR